MKGLIRMKGPTPPPSRRKLVREISIFLMGIGILLAGVGFLLLTQDTPRPPGRNARGVGLTYTLLALGGVQFLCGLLFLLTRQTVLAILGAAASAVMAVVALVVGGVSLITLLFAVSPILMGQRIALLIKTKEEETESPAP